MYNLLTIGYISKPSLFICTNNTNKKEESNFNDVYCFIFVFANIYGRCTKTVYFVACLIWIKEWVFRKVKES